MSDLNRYVLREAVSGPDQQAYHSIRRSVLFDARGRTGYDENYPEETKPNNLRLLLLCDDQPVCAFRLDRAANNVGIIRLMAVTKEEQRKGERRVERESPGKNRKNRTGKLTKNINEKKREEGVEKNINSPTFHGFRWLHNLQQDLPRKMHQRIIKT